MKRSLKTPLKIVLHVSMEFWPVSGDFVSKHPDLQRIVIKFSQKILKDSWSLYFRDLRSRSSKELRPPFSKNDGFFGPP